MPRNKTAKRSSARNSSMNNMNHYQNLEKEFMGIPGKFATQVKKEIAANKQKGNKLKAAWSKSKKAVKAAEAKIKAATKNKSAAASKKMMVSAKKVYTKATDTFNALNKQVTEVNNVVDALKAKHAKLAALGQCLVQFNKDWANSASASAAVEAKPVKATKKRKAKVIPLETVATTTAENHFDESVEDEYNDAQSNEEVASN